MLPKVKELIRSRESDAAGFLCKPDIHAFLISRWKRIARGTLQIPFGLAAGIGLAAILTLIFAVEVFMSEVYNGPFKQFLVDLQSI